MPGAKHAHCSIQSVCGRSVESDSPHLVRPNEGQELAFNRSPSCRPRVRVANPSRSRDARMIS
jgi:hypothetical protein